MKRTHTKKSSLLHPAAKSRPQYAHEHSRTPLTGILHTRIRPKYSYAILAAVTLFIAAQIIQGVAAQIALLQ